MEENVHDKVEDILNSFNGMQRAELPPFFETRLLARIHRLKEEDQPWLPLRRPVWAITVLSLFLLLNAGMLVYKNKNTGAGVTGANKSLQGFASEYNLEVSTIKY